MFKHRENNINSNNIVVWFYFLFLLRNIVTKPTVWVIGFIYLFFTFMFLWVVPFILNQTPWTLWHNVNMGPQTMMLYVAALFSAIISISVFRSYRDNGFELIISSKPLSRTKTVAVKFAAFFVFTLFFANVSMLIAPITLSLNGVTVSQMAWLMLSLFVANFITVFIFGLLGTFISLFTNKIWTILGNVICVVLIMIFGIVSFLSIKSPSGLAKDDNHAITSTSFLSKDGTANNIGSITPDFTSMNDYNLDNVPYPFTYDQEKEMWNDYQKKSTVNVANCFDFGSQYVLLNNLGELQTIASNDATTVFGSNRFYEYQLNDQSFVQSYLGTNDDQYSNVPMYYVTMPTSFNIDPNTYDNGAEDIITAITSAITTYFQMIAGQNIVMLGNTITDVSAMNVNFSSMRNYSKSNLVITSCVNGYEGSKKTTVHYSYDDFNKWMNDNTNGYYRKQIFDKIINYLTYVEPNDAVGYDVGTLFMDSLYRNHNVDENHDQISFLSNAWADNSTLETNKIGSQPDFSNSYGIFNRVPIESTSGGKLEIGAHNVPPIDGEYLPFNDPNLLDLDDKAPQNMYDLLHLIIVGMNNKDTNIFSERYLKEIPNNVFGWDKNDNSEQAKYELSKTMVFLKLYMFQKLTNELHSCFLPANKTSLDMPLGLDNSEDFIIQSNPVLPIEVRSDTGQYNWEYDIPGEVEKIIQQLIAAGYLSEKWNNVIGEVISLLNFGTPNLTYFKLPSNNVKWDDSLETGYFANKTNVMKRNLLGFATANQQLGYDNVNDATNYERVSGYTPNLNTTSINFPVLYEILGAQFTTTPKINVYGLIIGWLCICIAMSCGLFVIYMRMDFK